MDRFAHPMVCGLLLAAAGVVAGCSGSASGLITGTTTEAAPDAPGTLSNDHPLARPVAVAWTSARAEKCGFYFDPAKLRASYLAYEAKQSNAEQLGKAQQAYDFIKKQVSLGRQAYLIVPQVDVRLRPEVAERLGLLPKGGIIEGGNINEQLAAGLGEIENELARERRLRSVNKTKPRKG